MSKSNCSGCTPSYNFCQFAHMGIGGCQECYDTTYKNDSFNTSKYMAEINECVNETLNEYLKNIRESTKKEPINENIENIVESNECSICYEPMGDKNICVTECGHKFCLKCLLIAMDRNNTCPICRHLLKDNSSCVGGSSSEAVINTANGNLLLNEVNLQDWIDSLPYSGVNLDVNDLDYIIRSVLIDNNNIDHDN